MKHLFIAALLTVVVFVGPDLSAGPRLVLSVSPAMAMAPASLTVRATIEPSDVNRQLNIQIDSATYHRSSEIPLDGRSAPRVNVFELRDVPTGLHEVRAVLIGPQGPIANAMQLVKVEAGAGSR